MICNLDCSKLLMEYIFFISGLEKVTEERTSEVTFRLTFNGSYF